MYALVAQSGTTVLYHSWAGLAASMNNFHGAQHDSSACFANDLGTAAILECEELCSAHLIHKSMLTLVGFRTSNNKTIPRVTLDLFALVSGLVVKNKPLGLCPRCLQLVRTDPMWSHTLTNTCTC